MIIAQRIGENYIRTVLRTEVATIMNTLKQEPSFSRRHTIRKQDKQTLFCSCDLDLDPMTLTDESDLDLLKIYLHTKNELSRSMLSTVRVLQTDRQRDRRDRTHYHAAFTGGGSGGSRNEYYLGGIIALLLQNHRTMSTKSVCSNQYMVTDQH